MTIPFDKERLEKTLEAFDALWAKVPGIDRDKVERQLVGGTILGVYPLIGRSNKGETYLNGFSLAIMELESHKVITVDVDACIGETFEDEVGISIDEGYVEPEETAFI